MEQAVEPGADCGVETVGAMVLERRRLQMEGLRVDEERRQLETALRALEVEMGLCTMQEPRWVPVLPGTQSVELESGRLHVVNVDAVFGGEGGTGDVVLHRDEDVFLRWMSWRSGEDVRRTFIESGALMGVRQMRLGGDRVGMGWSTEHCGPHTKIYAGKMAMHMGELADSCTLGEYEFTSGKHAIRVKAMLTNQSEHTGFVGVVRKGYPLDTFVGATDRGWGYGSSGMVYHNGKRRQYGERWGCLDVITTALDLEAGTISFRKNGVDQGIAFRNVHGPLFLAVSSRVKGYSFKLQS